MEEYQESSQTEVLFDINPEPVKKKRSASRVCRVDCNRDTAGSGNPHLSGSGFQDSVRLDGRHAGNR